MRIAFLALPMTLWACGPSSTDPDTSVDASTADGDHITGGDTCFTGSGWQTAAVTSTPGSATHNGDIAFTGSGKMWVAFSDPQTGTSPNQDVFTTQLDGCTWSKPEVRNPDSTFQMAYPSLVATGETVHLAFNGLLDGATQNNDIYYAKYANGTWSSSKPITQNPPGDGVGAFEPVLAASSDGNIAVAFLFGGDVTAVGPDVRVGWIRNGQLEEMVPALTGFTGGCDAPQLVIDAAGVRHVAAACGTLSDARVYYTNDSGGSFATPAPIDTSTGMYNGLPQLALDPDGSTLHLAWYRNLACGTSTCGEIVYSRRAGTSWSTPVYLTGGSATREAYPSMNVSPSGTVYIAFERDNASRKSDIFVATSTDGMTFNETIVTPNTDDTSETLSSSMVFDPKGHPHFAFAKVLGGDPFDMEVWRAELMGN